MKKTWEYYWERGKLVAIPPENRIRDNKLTEEGEIELREIISKQRIPHTFFTISQILVIVSFLVIAWGLSLWIAIFYL